MACCASAGVGSGFVWATDKDTDTAWIVTNYHVSSTAADLLSQPARMLSTGTVPSLEARAFGREHAWLSCVLCIRMHACVGDQQGGQVLCGCECYTHTRMHTQSHTFTLLRRPSLQLLRALRHTAAAGVILECQDGSLLLISVYYMSTCPLTQAVKVTPLASPLGRT